MKIFNSIWITIKNLLSGPFYFIASFVSILALVPAFSGSSSAIISLYIFCFVLLAILISILIAIHKIIGKKHEEPYKKVSTFISFETGDGKKIIYEVFKVIQCKRPILKCIDYDFKWSGTVTPIISSSMQTIGSVYKSNSATDFDKAVLTFKTPLYYDQCVAVHFRAELDDTDGHASPYLAARVDEPVELIHFRVILQHKKKTFDANAILERRKIGPAVNAPFDKIKEVSFDKVARGYEYIYTNPEVGYDYKIRWIK